MTDAPLDEWFGVSTNSSGGVTYLSLDSNQLSGAIPAELGNLARLWYLGLAGNGLSGSIPPELGRLRNLSRLWLHNNQLSGSIPPELGRLVNLRYLDFSANQLTGAIPAELGRLTSLEDLSLPGNQLTGAIPAELGRLTSLEDLSIGGNQLTGAIPRDLMHLELTDLGIRGTGVCVPADAAFQAWVANLGSFRSSGLTCEGLLVSFTPGWYTVAEGARVPVTVHLSAAEAPDRAVTIPLASTPGGGATAADFEVPVTVTFGPADTTRTFVFEARADASSDDGETVTLGLGSPLPPEVTAGNPATATVTLTDYDRVARDREALEALYHATGGPGWRSRTNWLSDEPLSAWAGVRTNREGRVTRLALDRNRLRGVLPTALGDLTALESLELFGNELRGAIPRELGRLADLEVLSLFDNELTGSIPSELGRLANLEELHLFDNQLTGPVPPGLGNLARLEWLNLRSNQLTGPIPGELVNLAGLEHLILRSNQLTGAIPPGLGNLANLVQLALFDNQLSGPIPPELGNLSGLEYLGLHENRLSGSIPDTLGGLGNLQRLVLGGNPLSGPMPHSLMQLSALRLLHIPRTGVCEPADAAFQAWLATIRYFTASGHSCGMSVTVAFGSAGYTVAEGEAVPVTVRLSPPAGREVTVALTVVPGGGATAADYAGVPASVTFGPVDAVRTFWVEARPDMSPDAGETIGLGIGAPLPAGVTAGTPATATVTLVDGADGGAQDRAVLEALYHATGGPDWGDSTNWLERCAARPVVPCRNQQRRPGDRTESLEQQPDGSASARAGRPGGPPIALPW